MPLKPKETNMSNKTEEIHIIDKLYGAYLEAGGNSNPRESFICGMQAALWFFDCLSEKTTDPVKMASSFIRFRAEVREKFDELNLREVETKGK
jgi:hypothetical protein